MIEKIYPYYLSIWSIFLIFAKIDLYDLWIGLILLLFDQIDLLFWSKIDPPTHEHLNGSSIKSEYVISVFF